MDTREAVTENIKVKFDQLSTNEKSTFRQMDSELKDSVNDQLLTFRKHLKNYLLALLGAEILFLMALIALQGFRIISLNDWFLGVFTNVCLLQTFFLIKWIVSHIFPADPQKMGWLK